MRKAEGPSFRSVGSGEGQGRSGKRIRETQVDDTSAGRFPDFSVSATRPEKKDGERNIGKTVRLSTIFLYIYSYAAARASDEPPARGIRRETAVIVFGADPAACIRRRRTFRPGGPARTVPCADRRRSFPVRFGGGRSPCAGGGAERETGGRFSSDRRI